MRFKHAIIGYDETRKVNTIIETDCRLGKRIHFFFVPSFEGLFINNDARV